MNYALIFAGGVGTRMNTKSLPKQFLEVRGKPVIVHTMEHFARHEEIEGICVLCVADWLDYLKKLVTKYNIPKVLFVLAGGTTALETQYIGLRALKQYEEENNFHNGIVLIHDGVRPLINEKNISDCIAGVKEYGSAVTVAPATETIVKVNTEGNIVATIKRSDCMLARAPQSFYIKDILATHDKAIAAGKHDFIDSASMMLHYGYQVHVINGSVENLKVTTASDFYICRALLDARENEQLNGL